jgi:WD40 repeat protein
VLLWDFVSELASCVASFPQRHTGDVKCVCLRDGRLVSGGFDGSVRVTDVKPVEHGFVTAAGGLVASVADCVVQ